MVHLNLNPLGEYRHQGVANGSE